MSLAVGVIAGTAGASLSNLVLAPLYAANQYIGSFYFGNGMILGEREMYQDQWPKIKLRLDKGEQFINILEEFVTKDTTAIMANARQIVLHMTPLWYEIVTSYIKSIPQELINAINSVIQDPAKQIAGDILPKNFQNPFDYGPLLEQLLTKGITFNLAGLNLGGGGGNFFPEAFAEVPVAKRGGGDKGFIGPVDVPDVITKEEVLLDNKYKDMAFAQLESELNAGIRGNMSWLEKRVILKWINIKRPAGTPKKTLQDIIDSIDKFTGPGLIREIARLYAIVSDLAHRYWLLHTNPRRRGDRDWRTLQNRVLDKAKEFNRFVQANRKPGLTIDTDRLIRTGTIAPLHQ